jgi:hypothetical protein
VLRGPSFSAAAPAIPQRGAQGMMLDAAIRTGGHCQAVAPLGNQSVEHPAQQQQKKVHETTPHMSEPAESTELKQANLQSGDRPKGHVGLSSEINNELQQRQPLAAAWLPRFTTPFAVW